MSTAAASKSRLARWMTSEHPFPWLLPATALMVIFGIYPLLYAIWLSLPSATPVTRKVIFDPTSNWLKALRRRARVERDVQHLPLYRPRARHPVDRSACHRAAARYRPQGLWHPARPDDLAAGRAAGRHRHDVPADARRLLRRAEPLLYAPGCFRRNYSDPRHGVRPPWPACCLPISGNGRPSWC